MWGRNVPCPCPYLDSWGLCVSRWSWTRCAQVSCYPMAVLFPVTSWSTWNSFCCSSGASCSPELLLTPGISTGIKLVGLGWIQVLQVWIHLVLLKFTENPPVLRTFLRLWDLSWGETCHFWGFFGSSQVRSAWARRNSSLGGGRSVGRPGCGVGLPVLHPIQGWVCDLLTWMLLDFGICSPGWVCAPNPAFCSPLSHLVQPVPSGSAHLDAPRFWDQPPAGGHRDPNPPTQLLPPLYFPDFDLTISFSSSFPTLEITPNP